MKHKTQFGFMYRGNGFGFWDTDEEAVNAGLKYREKDHSDYVKRSGRPPITVYLCRDRKPVRPIYRHNGVNHPKYTDLALHNL